MSGGTDWERRLVTALIAVTLLLTSLPYLIGYLQYAAGDALHRHGVQH